MTVISPFSAFRLSGFRSMHYQATSGLRFRARLIPFSSFPDEAPAHNTLIKFFLDSAFRRACFSRSRWTSTILWRMFFFFSSLPPRTPSAPSVFVSAGYPGPARPVRPTRSVPGGIRRNRQAPPAPLQPSGRHRRISFQTTAVPTPRSQSTQTSTFPLPPPNRRNPKSPPMRWKISCAKQSPHRRRTTGEDV